MVGGQLNQLVHDRQMVVAASLRTRLPFPLPTRLPGEGIFIRFTRQMVRAIGRGRLFTLLAKQTGL